MKQPLALSLIIPAYNEEQHLKACLDSIASQKTLPTEVIVVDNNSTDGTVLLAKSYPFVRIVTESQQGIVYARNAGFNAARHPLIGRIDADSILPPDWVDEVMGFYNQPNRQRTSLTGGGVYYNVPFKRFSRWMLDLLAFRVNRLTLGHHFLFGSNMVIPAAVWNDITHDICVRNDIHEDIDLAIHAHRAGSTIVYKRTLLVGVKLRRVFQDHNKLWGVLMLWPQSYKVHGNKFWLTGWVGAILLYSITPLIYPARGLQILRSKLFSRR